MYDALFFHIRVDGGLWWDIWLDGTTSSSLDVNVFGQVLNYWSSEDEKDWGGRCWLSLEESDKVSIIFLI